MSDSFNPTKGERLYGNITDRELGYMTDNMEICVECGKPMDESEHNYGTETMIVCIHCWNYARTNP